MADASQAHENQTLPRAGAILLTVPEAAGLLAMSERQLRRLMALRRVPPPVRIGRMLRFRAADLAAWTDAGCPHADDFEAARPPTRGARRAVSPCRRDGGASVEKLSPAVGGEGDGGVLAVLHRQPPSRRRQ